MDTRTLETTDLPYDKFNLENYFSYVGLGGFRITQLSLQSLTTIIEHHLSNFDYKNTKLYESGKIPLNQREAPSLQRDELFSYMIKNKGGYCIQHLELMHAVLSELNFHLDRHVAKICMRECSKIDGNNENSTKTHELLVVHLNNERYLVDVGMANDCLRKPLLLKEGIQTIYDEQYRLTKINDLWQLDTNRKNEWFCFYHFSNSPVKYSDVDALHKNLFFSEKHLVIRDDLFLVARTNLEKRKCVFWDNNSKTGFFKSFKRGEPTPKTIDFLKYEEAYAYAEKKFKL